MEWEVVKSCRKNGWIAFRSAGSHSIVDVVAIDPKDMTVRLFQCKNKKMRQSEVNREVNKIKSNGLHTCYKTMVYCYLVSGIEDEDGTKWTLV